MILRGKELKKWRDDSVLLQNIIDKALVLKEFDSNGTHYQYFKFRYETKIYYALFVNSMKWTSKDVVVSEDKKEEILAEIL